MNDVRCPRCRALFTPDELRAADPTARCGFCGTELLVRLPPPPPPSPPPPEMPASVELVEVPRRRADAGPGGDPYRSASVPVERPGLQIRWQDRRFLAWFIAFGLFFVPHLVLGIILVGAHPWTFGALVMILAFAYFAVATIVNRTTLRIDGVALEWSRGPLPMWPRRRIAANDIGQVFAVRETAKQRATGISTEGGLSGDSVHYAVKMKTRLGGEHEIADMPTPEQARWLEYAIERHLGIEDRPVEGELPRPREGAS